MNSKQNIPLQELVSILVHRFELDQIILFGEIQNTTVTSGCFQKSSNKISSHYFLLLVTTHNIRIEHSIQDFVNNTFKNGQVTILAHGIQSIKSAISEHNRFFTTIYKHGSILYSKIELTILEAIINYETLALSTAQIYTYHFSMATNFHESGIECLERAGLKNEGTIFCTAMFCFHQTLEQALKALIYTFTGYRIDSHNLKNSLEFTLSFSNVFSEIFPRYTEEQKRIFSLLIRSYNEARYNTAFNPSERDVHTVLDMINTFLTTTKQQCGHQIEKYKTCFTLKDQIYL